jgi:hypothetical protein
MTLERWAVVAIAVWFGVEFGIGKRAVRVAVQCCLVLVLVAGAFSLGRSLGFIMPTMQGNQLLKNLTRSLETITTNTDEERSLLQARLKKLNEGVLPTYQTFSHSREAVEEFLNAYEMKFDPDIEMPRSVE